MSSLTDYYSDYKWIKVQRYKEDETLSYHARYLLLIQHHVEETTFLIDEVRKLAAEVDKLREK